MRPFKLHVKTTLIVSAVVVAIFLIVAYVYTVLAVRIEHKQYEERALQLATFLADRYALRGATFRGESQSELLAGYGFDLTLQQWYRFATPNDGVVTVESTGVAPGSSSPQRDLTSEEVRKLIARDFPAPELVDHPDGRFSVFAVAPVIVNDRIREYVVGAVGVRLDIPAEKSLAWQMTRLTLASMALIVFGIAITTYLLFKRLVYVPVETLLTGMARAESGDLTVEVPVRAADEIGQLTTRFNHMVDRLRENADLAGRDDLLRLIVIAAVLRFAGLEHGQKLEFAVDEQRYISEAGRMIEDATLDHKNLEHGGLPYYVQALAAITYGVVGPMQGLGGSIAELPPEGYLRFGRYAMAILGSLNVCSKEWIIRQYDHEVQGGSVVKPLVGVTVMAAVSLSVVVTDTSLASTPL